jgi:hypothetical protein
VTVGILTADSDAEAEAEVDVEADVDVTNFILPSGMKKCGRGRWVSGSRRRYRVSPIRARHVAGHRKKDLLILSWR